MPVDVLEQGPDQEPAARSRSRGVAVVLVALAALVAGALQVRSEAPPTDGADGADGEQLRPLPRVLLDRAVVRSVRPRSDGVLDLAIGLTGVRGAQVLSLDVELPGSAVVLAPTPDRLAEDGTALVALEALPECPDALSGLSRGAVNAAVRGRAGSRVRQVRVRLDTAGAFAGTVRTRCGPEAGVPDLRTSPVELDGAPGEPLRTRTTVSQAGRGRVTIVAVRPGPGLRTTVRSPLPLVVIPGGPPATVLVDLRPAGCGGAPDTPPYVLVLSTGEAVATSVASEAQPPLDALRPYRCLG